MNFTMPRELNKRILEAKLFKTVGIIAKAKVKNIDKIVEELIEYFDKMGVKTVLGHEAAESLGKSGVDREHLAAHVDLIVVLGGDGTFISAARSVNESKKDTPILGVNLGRMGFLTEVPLSKMFEALDKVFVEHDFLLEERMMLDVEIYNDSSLFSKKTVFNDAVVSKGALARIVPINVKVSFTDEELEVATYYADGLIVSTPSGSTAYNLAAGGPIVYPTMDCVILTPICPHTLSNRPLVLPDNAQLTIRVVENIKDVMATLDGQIGYEITPEQRIVIRKSTRKIKLITHKEKNYFDVLRTKLNWEERKVRSVQC